MAPMRRLLTALLATATALVVAPLTSAEAGGVPHVLTTSAMGAARQAVIVYAPGSGSTTATVSLWTKRSDGWHQVRVGASARIGRNGMTSSKREGDGKTPMGIFPVGIGFGWYANPGTRLTWRVANSNSRWVDDSASAYYNKWMQAPAAGRWDSAERLRISPYTYAIEVGYNRAAEPGKGSAIFMHLLGSGATSGCIATDKTTVVSTLKWLNPTMHPVFVIGTKWWFANH